MLVLSRHKGESIRIGDDIVITLVDIRSNKIELGIEAPTSIPIHREEVHQRIHAAEAVTDVQVGTDASTEAVS